MAFAAAMNARDAVAFSRVFHEDADFTNEQIYIFRELISELEENGINIPLKHVANSMAVIGFNDAHLNLVRPGLVLYGLYPRTNLKKNVNFIY